ncbi:PIG-L deacetylase family protein [Streptomyces sp. NPDC004134]|uniref:PIG-L deacetylase family protein n=1 Tax=Streptomyces sp. NPDC004134 TaxID=3364691 RepID=UPI0036C2C5CA
MTESPRKPAHGGRLRMLAVGAHPDDIELGAGGLVAKAHELGHRVAFLILTDEGAHGPQRRREAVRAAGALGVAPGDVHFAGFPDGLLRADGPSVGRVRQLVRRHGIRPDLVVTHTQADSHNDHAETGRIAHAAFRDTAYLHFSIHISAESDRFSPRVFVRLTPDRLRAKSRALACYGSQARRIGRLELAKYEEKLGQSARLGRAEGFEVAVQYGTPDALRRTVGLSDSAFHRFWQPVVADDTVTLLYGVPDLRDRDALVHRHAAQDGLRRAFIDCWPPPYPLREQLADTDEALTVAAAGSVVTTCGPEDNRIAARLRASGRLAWAAEADGAGGGLRDLRTGRLLRGGARRHLGCVARVESPFRRGAYAVLTGGATEPATRAGLGLLADPGRCPGLLDVFDREPVAHVAYAVDPVTGGLTLVEARHGHGTPPL